MIFTGTKECSYKKGVQLFLRLTWPALSLLRDTNMAAMTSCEKALLLFGIGPVSEDSYLLCVIWPR